MLSFLFFLKSQKNQKEVLNLLIENWSEFKTKINR